MSSTLYLSVAIASALISMVVIGYFNPKNDEDLFPLCVFGIVISAAWPITLSLAAVIGVVTIPLKIGRLAHKIQQKREYKKKISNPVEDIKKR